MYVFLNVGVEWFVSMIVMMCGVVFDSILIRLRLLLFVSCMLMIIMFV